MLIIGWKELLSMVFSIGVGIVVKLSFIEWSNPLEHAINVVKMNINKHIMILFLIIFFLSITIN